MAYARQRYVPTSIPEHLRGAVTPEYHRWNANQFEAIKKSIPYATVIDLRDYAIDKSGDNSSYTEVQRALNEAAGVGPLMIPWTTSGLTIDAQLKLPSHTELIGQCKEATLNFTWDAASGEGGSTYLINSDTSNGNTKIALRRLTIQGAGDGTPFGASPSPVSGILIRKATHLEMEDVEFYRIPGISVAHQGVAGVQLDMVTVREGGRDGITGWWYASGWNMENVVYTNILIDSVGDDGLAFHASQADNPNTDVRPKNISVTGAVIRGYASVDANGAGRGLIVDGCENVTLGEIVIDTTFASGLHIDKDNVAASSAFRSRNITFDGQIFNAGQTGDGSQPQVGARITSSDHVTLGSKTVIKGSYAGGLYTTDTTFFGLAKGSRVIENGTTINDFGVDLDGTAAASNVLFADVDTISTGNAGGGIRSHYSPYARVAGTYVDNGKAGNGSASNGSGVIHSGDHPLVLGDIVARDTRAGASRTQTHGIQVQNTGGTPLVTMCGSVHSVNHPGNNVRIDNANTIIIKRGINESSTDRSNFDQDISGIKRFSGAGSPETVVTAPVGSTYNRSDGAAGTCFYVKETGVGNVGWVAK